MLGSLGSAIVFSYIFSGEILLVLLVLKLVKTNLGVLELWVLFISTSAIGVLGFELVFSGEILLVFFGLKLV